MKEKKPLTTMWKKAKALTDQNNIKAVPMWETMLIYLSKLSLKGITQIEGVSVDLMKSRAWLSIEQLVGLPEYFESDETLLGSKFKNS